MKCFKDRNFITKLGKISGTGKTGRSRTYNRHLFTVLLSRYRGLDSVFAGIIGNKSFKFTDGNGFTLNASDTFAFTLTFLRAYSSANGGKGG